MTQKRPSRHDKHPTFAAVCTRVLAAAFLVAQLTHCGGTRPENVGNFHDPFAPCPETPNCVSSLAPASDKTHYIKPFELATAPAKVWPALIRIVEDYPRSKIVTHRGNYLYAEFTSLIMRYVDDVEFYLDDDNTINVRSASRIGHGDFGVNRERIENIRTKLQEAKLIR